MLPTFIIAGAAKAGTYTLWYYLKQHPQISMSEAKEPKYFCDPNYEKGISFYESFFEGCDNEPAIGEASVEYMADPDSPQRIKSLLPNVKLIFALRNPVERAWSHYWYRHLRGQEPRSFDEVVAGGKDEFPIRYGMYFRQIKIFSKHFPIDNICFVISERLENDIHGEFKRIFEFLKVDEDFKIKYYGKKNQTYAWHNKKSAKQITKKIRKFESKRIFQNGVLSRVEENIRNVVAGLWLKSSVKGEGKPQMSDYQRKTLEDIFSKEVKDLRAFLNDPIDEWE